MPIRFKCNLCGKALKVDESKAGKRVRCPGCTEVILIPKPEEELVEVEYEYDQQEDQDDENQDDENQDDDEDDDRNPFRGPKSRGTAVKKKRSSGGRQRLSSPLKRLRGAFLDFGVVLLVGLIPFGIAVYIGSGQKGSSLASIFILIGMLGLLGTAVANLYLLATQGQSIGKLLLKMQVVDYENGGPAGFVKVFLLRGVVNGILGIVPFYGLVDLCFIFGEEHRCLHDLIAGTKVVDID
jgi:uncharacterized RDD family membrane protein YckC/DNA-directed RNA polymerase subunit RPC12/RpoP